MKKIGIAILVIILIGGGYVFLQNKEVEEAPGVGEISFAQTKKSAHYESNTPSHGAVLAGVPVNVVINFNFDVVAPSSISILKEGVDYGEGEVLFDSNGLSMRRVMDTIAPDGLYTVEYKACWPDRSCHDGSFQFVIDRTAQSSYIDMTGKTEVTIRMSEIAFKPKQIKISKGTRITWINDESAVHYVNTDSHPAHTYFKAQNSRAIAKGEQYELVFDESGVYPYHCSAHADTMVGTILVI